MNSKILYTKLILAAFVITTGITTVTNAHANNGEIEYGIDLEITSWRDIRDFFYGKGLNIGLTADYAFDEDRENVLGARLGLGNFLNWNSSSDFQLNSSLFGQVALDHSIILGSSIGSTIWDGGGVFNLLNATLDVEGTGTINEDPFSISYDIEYLFEEEKFINRVSGDFLLDNEYDLGFTVNDLFSPDTNYRLRFGLGTLFSGGDLEIEGDVEVDIDRDGVKEFELELEATLKNLTAQEIVDTLGINFPDLIEEINDLGLEVGEDDIELDRLVPIFELDFEFFPRRLIPEEEYDVSVGVDLEKQKVPESSSILSLLALGILGIGSVLNRKLKGF